jgi:hypothetical protein
LTPFTIRLTIPLDHQHPETVPKSTPHLAAPTAETQATAHSATPDLSRQSLGEGGALPAPVFHDAKHHIKIFQGDCLDILAAIPESCVDLIFADPPYFLSNNGITCHVRPHGQRQ